MGGAKNFLTASELVPSKHIERRLDYREKIYSSGKSVKALECQKEGGLSLSWKKFLFISRGSTGAGDQRSSPSSSCIKLTSESLHLRSVNLEKLQDYSDNLPFDYGASQRCFYRRHSLFLGRRWRCPQVIHGKGHRLSCVSA